MNHKLLARHQVKIFRNQQDKDEGRSMTILTLEQWPLHGFIYYMVNGEMYPGFEDPHSDVDACIILTNRTLA